MVNLNQNYNWIVTVTMNSNSDTSLPFRRLFVSSLSLVLLIEWMNYTGLNEPPSEWIIPNYLSSYCDFENRIFLYKYCFEDTLVSFVWILHYLWYCLLNEWIIPACKWTTLGRLISTINPPSPFKDSDWFSGPWIPALPFKNSDRFSGSWISAFRFQIRINSAVRRSLYPLTAVETHLVEMAMVDLVWPHIKFTNIWPQEGSVGVLFVFYVDSFESNHPLFPSFHPLFLYWHCNLSFQWK